MPFILQITNSCLPLPYKWVRTTYSRLDIPSIDLESRSPVYILYMHLFDSTITECALDSPGADDAHPRRPPNFPRASERELEDVSATEATGIRPGPDTPHTFSPPRIPRDRVAPKGLDPRAATRPHRFAAQSRMTIAPPPPTQPSRAARSSSSGARGGGSERPISARSSYAASNLGHVIGGRRFFVSLAVAVEQRRSRGSGRFVPHDPSLSLFDLRKDESLRPLPILYPQLPHHSASLVPFRGTETERSSSHLSRASTNSWACFPLPVAFYTLCPFPTLCRPAEFSDWNTWLTSLGAGTIRAPAPLIICPPSLWHVRALSQRYSQQIAGESVYTSWFEWCFAKRFVIEETRFLLRKWNRNRGIAMRRFLRRKPLILFGVVDISRR